MLSPEAFQHFLITVLFGGVIKKFDREHLNLQAGDNGPRPRPKQYLKSGEPHFYEPEPPRPQVRHTIHGGNTPNEHTQRGRGISNRNHIGSHPHLPSNPTTSQPNHFFKTIRLVSDEGEISFRALLDTGMCEKCKALSRANCEQAVSMIGHRTESIINSDRWKNYQKRLSLHYSVISTVLVNLPME